MVENNRVCTFFGKSERRGALADRFVSIIKRKIILFNAAVHRCQNVSLVLRQSTAFKRYSTRVGILLLRILYSMQSS